MAYELYITKWYLIADLKSSKKSKYRDALKNFSSKLLIKFPNNFKGHTSNFNIMNNVIVKFNPIMPSSEAVVPPREIPPLYLHFFPDLPNIIPNLFIILRSIPLIKDSLLFFCYLMGDYRLYRTDQLTFYNFKCIISLKWKNNLSWLLFLWRFHACIYSGLWQTFTFLVSMLKCHIFSEAI